MAQYYYIIYIQYDAQTYVLLIVHIGVFDKCRIPTINDKRVSLRVLHDYLVMDFKYIYVAPQSCIVLFFHIV